MRLIPAEILHSEHTEQLFIENLPTSKYVN